MLQKAKISELTGKEFPEDRVGLIFKSLVSPSEILPSFLFRKFLLKVLYVHQKYTTGFSGNTSLALTVTLKIAAFSISLFSRFKMIFHSFEARIVMLYLLFVSLKAAMYNKIVLRKIGLVMIQSLQEFKEKTLSAFPFFTGCRKRSLKIFN